MKGGTMIIKRILKFIVSLLALIIFAFALTFLYWLFRPNRADVSETIVTDYWSVVSDGYHNSNTDMIYWNDAFYLIHARAPWHFASESTRLVLLRSKDAREWEEISEFQNPGEDIRDPKFAIIDDRLFLYFLKNKNFPAAEPYYTLYTSSNDGVTWDPYGDVGHDGWLFWRPKTLDDKTWYVGAYWHEHGRSILLKSDDGRAWDFVSEIYEGDFNDETAVEFLPDGRLLATGRLEVAGYYFGDMRGNTLIATAEPPYTEWTKKHSFVTRLDGPYLFTYHDRVYAIGRYEPGLKRYLMETGSILNRKRTAVFLVTEDDLVYLTDLPSAGDTSYPGVVIEGDTLYACYYTSNINRDYPWVLGMVASSDIMMVTIDLKNLERSALEKMRTEE
jgi:hypothetical protein